MRNIESFLAELSRLDIKLWVAEGRLHCDAPQGVLTPELQATLAEYKTTLIPWLQKEALINQPIQPMPRTQTLPLSFAQRRLWFLNQLENSSAYNMPAALRLTGRLHQAALAQSLQALVQRHETLRTSFPLVQGEPVVQISDAPFQLQVLSLTHLTGDEQQQEVQRLVQEHALHPFNLATGPLFIATLLQLGTDSHVLLLNVHHIVADGWSIGIIVREWSALYEAMVQGKPSPLPPLPIQYVDFAHWQQQWLSDSKLESLLTYWKQQLSGYQPLPLPLLTDYPSPAMATFQGAHHSLRLSSRLTREIKRQCQQTQVTLFMFLLTAFKVMLYRYTGHDDIIVGTPVAARDRSEIEGLIGLFLNTLALRTNLSGNPSFRELLQRVREVALGAYAHQDLPFEKLVEELQPERHLHRHPLFDVVFNFVNTPSATSLQLADLSLEFLELPEDSKLLWTLYVEATEEVLTLKIVYQAALISQPRIAVFLEQLQFLLEQVVTAIDSPLSAYSLVTPAVKNVLPNPSVILPEPPQLPLTEQLRAWVTRTPTRSAVIQAHRTWTYQELFDRAQSLAQELVHRGLQRREVVAIFGVRSFGLIVSMIGVWLSGGVLLTLDANLPSRRRQVMCQEAGANYLLYLGEPPPTEEMQQFSIKIGIEPHTGRFPKSSHRQVRPLPTLHEEDAAYIFFTSGTTGTPKGILGWHKGLSHFLNWQRQTFGIQPNERVAQLIGMSFDPILRDIFLPLTSGATLYLPPAEYDLRPSQILPWLEQERISLVHAVPSVAQAWLNQVPPNVTLQTLRWLFFSGEPLTDKFIRQWRKVFPLAGEMVNFYGPTETTFIKCYYRVPLQTLPGVQPVGYPLPETQVLVMGNNQQLCGINEPGEIVVRTPFRTLGYINASADNQRRFVKNRATPQDTDVLYYTGDLGRYRMDGSLEFLGRIDNQVKVHGVRIELGEIEAVLTQHPALKENVVVVQETADTEDKRLVAYFVLEKGQTVDKSALRQFLKERLPSSMIPSALVTLTELPLTHTGKVDRQKLARLPLAPEQWSEEPFVAPRNPTEEVLAGIWTELLKVAKVGVFANFFELGGHSLLATQVLSRIREAFHLELPLREFFEAPTIAGLSECLQTVHRASAVAPITPIPRVEPLPLSFAQQRLWFLNQLEGPSATYNIASALHLAGLLDQAALEQSLQTLVQRHENLRVAFPTVAGKPVVQRLTSPWQLEVLDLTTLEAGKQSNVVQRLMVEDATRPFDLETGPLFRVKLLKLASHSQVLLFNMHHIISDVWSIEVFIREWSTLYQAFRQGMPSPLPPLPIQYLDFAHWQRQWLTEEVLARQVEYWKQQLTGCPALLELPTDFPRPPVQRFQGASVPLVIAPALTAQLKQLSQQAGGTLFMTLLSAFAVLLARYSGQPDIVMGSPIANRTHQQTEGLIGFFVNTLVLRLNLSNNPSFATLLQQAKRVALDAYSHQDIPFEQLVEELQPPRSLSYAPLFQVMLVLQNAPLADLQLAGLQVTLLEQEHTNAKFDLTWTVMETSQGLVGRVEYNTDLFQAATIERLIGHLQTLLAGVVENPAQPIQELPLLTVAERQQLQAWNDTAAYYPADQTLVDLFEAHVAKAPDAIALRFEEVQWSYRTLNDKANQLAHFLISLGVQPETLVGLCVERSPEMIVGWLGILKAGGAYVPLDPVYPAARLAFMLEDAKVAVLLTQAQLIAKLPPSTATLVCLEADSEKWATFPTDTPVTGVRPENLAYVIYTSGSTGQPKGVQIAHQGVCNLVWAQTKLFQVQPTSRILQFASLSFDASLWEMVMGLGTGATLCVARAEDLLPGPALLQLLRSQAITHLTLPPTALAVLPSDEGLTLQYLIVAGESCSKALATQWSVGRHFFNAYGPTEGTVCATAFENLPNTATLPIGKPIANTQIYILDSYLQLVPVGVPGELYLGGVGLARGYLNRPELTQERFIANPFGEDSHSRLYKTGDLARWLPDGNLEYLGRIDAQVKLRGFRIELGEIEAVLGQHPAVQDNAVVVHDTGVDKQLIAYVVLQPGVVLVSKEIQSFLTERLPSYMVPSAVLLVTALPLTPNGKVDRRALAQRSISREVSQATLVAPRTPQEQRLADLWKKVLGLEQVGIHDNFFDLGGHSLQAVQLIAQIVSALNVTLSVKQLFLHPTIAQLAKLLEAQTVPTTSDHSTAQLTDLATVPETHGHPRPSTTDHSLQSSRIERRSLLSLVLTQKIPPVTAAALSYVPQSVLTHTGLSRAEMMEQWFENLPLVSRILDTHWGRIATLTLPRLDTELYHDPADLVEVIVEALEIAKHLGARVVSLTGVLPSATRYGQAILEATAGRQLPQITTGHATTSAAVALALQRILQEGGRELGTERVGFIGLGSIGLSSLRLMLKCLPHPAELMLCDVYSKREWLERVQREVVDELGFRGELRLLLSTFELPKEIYNATCIVGATNVPDLLEITQLQPGTLIVDDSGPHCFKTASAISRLEAQQDILFTEGGVLKAPHSIQTLQYLPASIERGLTAEMRADLAKRNPLEITGCVFSSVLSASDEELKPTAGMVELTESVKHYEALTALGFQAADLHCEEYVLAKAFIGRFRERFGR